MQMQNNRTRPAPLNIKILKNKLADEHHKINTRESSSNIAEKSKKEEGWYKNFIHKLETQQQTPRLIQNQNESSIVMLNSPDVKLETFEEVKKQKGIFKIMKVQCGVFQKNIQQGPIQAKNRKQSVPACEFGQKSQDSLAEFSQIKFKKDISFNAASVHKPKVANQPRIVSEVSVKNPESINNFGKSSQILKQQVDESFELIQAEIESSLKMKADEVKQPLNFGQTPSGKKQSENALYTTLKKQSNDSRVHQNTTANNRMHKTFNHITSPLKRPTVFMVSQKSEKEIDILSKGIKKYKKQDMIQQAQFSNSNIQVQNCKSRKVEKSNSTNKFIKMVANIGSNKHDEQMQKLKAVMRDQKNLKLKDYLRLASLSNDSKFDRYSNSLTKNTIFANENLLTMQRNQSGTNMRKSYIFNKTKTAIDPSKSIILIKASLKKKLQKCIESALKLFQQIGQGSGFLGSQYEDLVFMCNIYRIFDENLFKNVSVLQQLMKSYIDRKKFHEMIQEEQLTQQKVLEIISPRKLRKKQLQQEQPEPDVNMLIQKILDTFLSIKKEKE